MTKLYYNSHKVNDNLLNQLFESKKKLNSLLREINNLSVPSSFPYRRYFINLSNKINNYIRILKMIEDKIDYSEKGLVRTFDDLNYNVSQIEKSDIKVRESIVK